MARTREGEGEVTLVFGQPLDPRQLLLLERSGDSFQVWCVLKRDAQQRWDLTQSLTPRCECMAEAVWVDAADAGVGCAPLKHLAQPVLGQSALATKPQPGKVAVGMAASLTELAVHRLVPLREQGDERARLPFRVTVNISDSRSTSASVIPDQVAGAHAGRPEQPDDRGLRRLVTAALEVVRLALRLPFTRVWRRSPLIRSSRHASIRATSSSEQITAGGRSEIFGGRIRAIGLTSISPSVSGHR